MLDKLLGLPHQSTSDMFEYLPVSTTLDRETEQLSKTIFEKHYKQSDVKPKVALKWGDFIPNEET